MKKFLLFFIIFLGILFFSACSWKTEKKEKKSTAPEIIIAQDCGLDKLPCCKTEPTCSFSQKCCINPSNPQMNYCSDICSFGSKGEFCRDTEPLCDLGTICKDGFCKECGGENQFCCSNNKCNENLVCKEGFCVKCGIDGNPCCPENKCFNETEIDESHNQCINGTCIRCGANNVACPAPILCLPGYLYNNNFCYACGEANQPCCDSSTGKSYECNPKKWLHCYLGFCIE